MPNAHITKGDEYSDDDHDNDDMEETISSKQLRRRQFRENSQLKVFRDEMKHFLVTTRFNNATWEENERYRTDQSIGCIYPTPEANSSRIAADAIMFVLEMNNDRNRIMGIGMVKNHAFIKKYRVYSNENYNRYAYLGKHRIDRSEMSEEEDQMMRVFDILCFTGARHMKRLQGIKQFPVDMLYRCSRVLDLVNYIREMFKRRLSPEGRTNSANTNSANKI
jgi:hypothetical protein